jgi:hypothetical protein
MTAKVPAQGHTGDVDAGGVDVMPEESTDASGVSRRMILRAGAVGGAGVALVAAKGLGGPFLSQKGLLTPDGAFAATSVALGDAGFYIENFPTSPLILSPFTDQLPVPKALRPIPRSTYSAWAQPPGPGAGQQNSLRNQQHQIWPSQIGSPDPIVYKIDVQVSTHSFTTSQVLPIDTNGNPAASFDAAGKTYPAGTKRTLPWCGSPTAWTRTRRTWTAGTSAPRTGPS